MTIRVLYFGVLKELMGSSGEPLELPEVFNVADLLQLLRERVVKTDAVWGSLAVAVNREYASADCALHDGDEVALLPPVSGGL